MNIGLAIQGPVVSFGQTTGPNTHASGFDSRVCVERNIKELRSEVSRIVISTWAGSNLRFYADGMVSLVESEPPNWPDFDNRLKQFTSTCAGVKWLTLNTNVTHIVKIRTDQVVPPQLLSWLRAFFLEKRPRFRQGRSSQQCSLVFSEFIPGTPFYAGDFIFAGTAKDMLAFSEANVGFGARHFHPQINADFLLKYLRCSDNSFSSAFRRGVPYSWQTAGLLGPAAAEYWNRLMRDRLAFIPQAVFRSIEWRGRLMDQILPDCDKRFGFYEQWSTLSSMDDQLIHPRSRAHAVKALVYEYRQYLKKIAKFVLRNIPRLDFKVRYGSKRR